MKTPIFNPVHATAFSTRLCNIYLGRYFSIIVCCLICGILKSQPIIKLFSPTTGPAGTTVVIQGQNFSPSPDSNAVYFGKAKADVMSSSANWIKVKAPSGATFEPISVTVNKLTGYSPRVFLETFTNGEGFTAGSFSSPLAINNSGYYNLFYDFDGDGKLDMISSDVGHNNYNKNINYSSFSVYRNTSQAGVISFTQQETHYLPNSPTNPINWFLFAADIDNDGKPDLLIQPTQSFYFRTYLLYKNTSKPGYISFAEPGLNSQTDQDFSSFIAYRDLNFDGTPELTFATASSYIRTENFKINGGASTMLGTGKYSHFEIADLDLDGKPDIAGLNVSQIEIGRNTTLNAPNNSTLSFNDTMSLSMSNSFFTIGDINKDTRPDIVAFGYTDPNSISIFENRSMPGKLRFRAPVSYSLPQKPISMFLTDMDGDGKVDILCYSSTEDNYNSVTNIFILKNTSVDNTVSFAQPVTYNIYPKSTLLAVGDIDGDSQPDILLSYTLYARPTAYYLKNLMAKPLNPPTISSFSPTVAGKGDSLYIKGKNFTGIASITLGDSAVNFFSVTSDSTITALVGNGATGQVSVKSSLGTSVKKGFTYLNQISINIFSSLPVTACDNSKDRLGQFLTTIRTTIPNRPANSYYVWFQNGIEVGNRSFPLQTWKIKTGDKIWAELMINGTSIKKSNVIEIGPLLPILKPSIKVITKSTTVCKGSNVTFSTSVVNSSADPFYQWLKNNIPVGHNTATYTDSALNDNDLIACIIKVAENCSVSPVISLPVRVTVINSIPAQPSAITGPSIVTAGSTGNTFSVSAAADAASWTWTVPKGTSITSGKGTNAIVAKWGSGGGQITVVASNACGPSSAAIKTVTIETTGAAVAQLTAFPNPARNNISIVLSGTSNNAYIIELRDSQGKLLQSHKNTSVKGVVNENFNTSNYSSGLYYVIAIDQKNNTISKQVIIEK